MGTQIKGVIHFKKKKNCW